MLQSRCGVLVGMTAVRADKPLGITALSLQHSHAQRHQLGLYPRPPAFGPSVIS
jgi:hypothetical protein